MESLSVDACHSNKVWETGIQDIAHTVVDRRIGFSDAYILHKHAGL